MLEVQLLNNAINILKRDGWTQGELHSNYSNDIHNRGAHCAMGAIIQAADEFDGKSLKTLSPAKERAFIALAKMIDPSGMDYNDPYGDPEDRNSVYRAEDIIASFNDDEAENVKDVIARMRSAISALKSGSVSV